MIKLLFLQCRTRSCLWLNFLFLSVSKKNSCRRMVGSIEPRKNHEVLYKAYSVLASEKRLEGMPEIIIVGGEYRCENFRDAVRLDPKIKGKIKISASVCAVFPPYKTISQLFVIHSKYLRNSSRSGQDTEMPAGLRNAYAYSDSRLRRMERGANLIKEQTL